MQNILKEYDSLISFINVVALILGFVGFVITIYQLRSSARDSRKISTIGESLDEQLGVLENHNSELAVIKESLSTKYIGQFPDFVSIIIELIGHAKRKIEIVCDFPCYCYFSDYKQHVRYTNILREKKANDVDVWLTCSISDNRKRLVLKQLKASNSDWKERTDVRTKLLEFLKREKINKDLESLTIADFNQHFDNLNLEALKTVFRGSNSEVPGQLPVYYWIVDDSRAIFSIPSFTVNDRGPGFLTNDAALISALKTINVELLAGI